MRCLTIAVVSLAAITACAATPDYFPLAIGNQWVYQGEGAAQGVTVVMSVDSSTAFHGVTYYAVTRKAQDHPWRKDSGLTQSPLTAGSYWLRQDEEGAVWAFDRTTQKESLWYDFGGKHSVPLYNFYSTTVPGAVYGCAAVSGDVAHIAGVMGERDALWIEYLVIPFPGLDKEWFVPGIGLVQQQMALAKGPATFKLAYWHFAAPVEGAPPELSITLALDRPEYSADFMPPTMNLAPTSIARLTLRNTTARPLTLTYPDSQRFDLAIRNSDGVEVYRWSKGMAFLFVLGTQSVTGEVSYVVAAPLVSGGGGLLPNGDYTAEAWLTSSRPPVYSATVGFRIANTM